MPRITKDHRRLARKAGWYEGQSHSTERHNTNLRPTPWPYEEIELCKEYEGGYAEGLGAKDDDRNPYGVYSK